jgi:hypothetical protein
MRVSPALVVSVLKDFAAKGRRDFLDAEFDRCRAG